MKTIFAIASIAFVAVVLGMSTTTLAMAQVEPACPTSTSTTLSWAQDVAIEGDPDVNLNGFVCVLSYTELVIPRITIDDI